jgi:hypothetical protein
MGVFKVEVTAYRCERCEHEWLPRNALAGDNDLPTVCPKCKGPYWNRPLGPEIIQPRAPESLARWLQS